MSAPIETKLLHGVNSRVCLIERKESKIGTNRHQQSFQQTQVSSLVFISKTSSSFKSRTIMQDTDNEERDAKLTRQMIPRC